MTRPDPRAWSVTEDQLMEHIRGMCRDLGLLAFHCRDSRRSWGPGFPDLLIASPAGVMFAECKSMTGNLSPDQRHWRSYLEAAGMSYRLWNPSHLLDGTIAAELASLSPLPVAVPAAGPM